jgi:hypothetical protein
MQKSNEFFTNTYCYIGCRYKYKYLKFIVNIYIYLKCKIMIIVTYVLINDKNIVILSKYY